MSTVYHIYDPRMRAMLLFNAAIEKIADGCRWAEGPVWFGDGNYLLWSDIPNNRILQWRPSGEVNVWRSPARHTNGHTRDREGRLISCEHGGRCVSRIWFTDPDYGILSDYEGHRAEREQSGCYVYRLDPVNGKLAIVAKGYERPNGLAFSPDEKYLYIADTGVSHREDGPHHIKKHPVIDGVKLGDGQVFAEIPDGFADGFRCDEHGNIWTSCGTGNAVAVYAPEGTPLGKIELPEAVSNLVFGGPNRNRLFITATSSVYALYVGVRGCKTV